VKRDELQQFLPEAFSPEAIQNELARILADQKFLRSKKLRRLLQFTVEQTLQGNAEALKEYVIGTEVLNKPGNYDPRRDSLVRVMASRLRAKLKEYYSNGGSEDALVIELPKGQYVPRFQTRESRQTEIEQKVHARNVCSRAKFLAAKFTAEALEESASLFEEAIEGDPRLVAAHSGLANVRALQAFLGLHRPREAWPAARSAAKIALEMDEMGSEAHLCIGMAEAFFEWRWQAAESQFGKAIETDPYSGAGHLWRALAVLIPTGRMPAAQAEIAQARDLAPAPFLQEAEVLALYLAGEHRAVLELTEQPVNKEASSNWLQWTRGLALVAVGWLQAAVDLLTRIDQATPGSPRVLSSLAYVYALSNQPEQVRQLAKTIEELRGRGVWISTYDQAIVQLGSGNREEALKLLHAALEEREPWLVFLNVDPRLRLLEGDPEFKAIAAQVFPEA